MSYLLSDPIEKLIHDKPCSAFDKTCEVLIIGSGYGGAIAAMRLANQNGSVMVFERGNEYMPGDFPESLGELPAHVQFLRPDRDVPIGNADALFDLRIGDPVSVLVGSGLGGGSLINANVAFEPDDQVLGDPAWPTALRNDRAKLSECFAAVQSLLGVNTDNRYLQKFGALQTLADSLGEVCRPAPITVTQRDGVNRVGIQQSACVGCGNCVTGCNVGSKNTLAMNALPLAKSRGAKLYTGATVLSIEPNDVPNEPKWKIRFRRTAVSKTVMYKDIFTMRAQVVILAAGTLGSTEILLRSQARCPDKLKFSEHLGSRFSTNGDVIAFGYAQGNKVNAVAHADSAAPAERRSARNIGPTITGYFQADADNGPNESGRRRRVTIEDGAVPSALAHVFGEVIASASLPKRYSKASPPAWFNGANRDKDPLSVHPEALRHSQVLLAMGDDAGQLAVELRHGDGVDRSDHDSATIHVCPESRREVLKSDNAAQQSVYDDIDALLTTAENKRGFDGGDYLPNPLWKLFPDELRQVSNAPAPGGKLLTVHPLGGCPMGDDARSGVVNHYGHVFRGDGPQKDLVYEGLYVMDGAILPCALGVNPFLTIAALAYRNSEDVSRLLGRKAAELGQIGNTPQDAEMTNNIEARLPKNDPAPVAAHQVSATFNERMVGRLEVPKIPAWLIAILGEGKKTLQLKERQGLVIDVEIQIKDVLHWLRYTNEPLNASAKLFANFVPGDTVPDEHVRGNQLAEGTGKVKLLCLDTPSCFCERLYRTVKAMWAFHEKRGFGDAFGSSRKRKTLCGLPSLSEILAFVRAARNHANWRHLRYSFTLTTGKGELRLDGDKVLAYAMDKKDPWTALVDLPITLRGDRDDSVNGLLRVDIIRLTRRAPFQVVQSLNTPAANTPAAIAGMASAGMMMLRVLFQTHFWSFGAPDYPQGKRVPDRDAGALRLMNGLTIKPQCIPLVVPVGGAAPPNENIDLRLTRYMPPRVTHGSILLIHGLAHGSRVFTTETTTVSLAAYLYENGYDVWLLDYRLSIALPDRIPGKWLAENQWTMDQIAHHDMHEAVKYVYEKTGGPIQVFAHCIGAGALEMAILSGDCQDGTHMNKDSSEERSMISALATHAVHPWVMASVVNRLHVNLAAFLKDAIDWKTLDAVLPDAQSVTAFDAVLDRIAGSIPWSKEEAERHGRDTDERMGQNICNRMTLIYGYEWKHTNLMPETHKDLANLVGITNLETFRQIYFIILRRRLTTRDGANKYVTDRNFTEYWKFPTLFAHGSDNEVYSPVSAIKSCLRLRALRDQAAIARPPNYDVYWTEIPNCGHMDFLFGKDAYSRVYPYLDAFFRRTHGEKMTGDLLAASNWLNQAPDANRDPHWQPPKTPTCGPIIGWVRKEGAHTVLRIWVEPYMFSATPASQMDVGPTASGITITKCPFPTDDYSPGTYWVYDVSIRPDFEQDIRISVGYAKGVVDMTNPTPPSRRLEVAFEELPLPPQHSVALQADEELHDAKEGVVIPLTRLPWFKRLKDDSNGDHAAFLVGSCRYPGSPFDEDLADKIFSAMCLHVNESAYRLLPGESKDRLPPACAAGIDHVLLVGDQIYADATADLFDTSELRERWARYYREAFGARYLRRVLARVPIYMALDDHEFEDNWPGNAEHLVRRGDKRVKDYMERFYHGRAAAKAYQWSMSSRSGWPIHAATGGLWYTFTSGGLPFFVMDSRTERTLRQENVGQAQAELINGVQLGALKCWLSDASCDDKPKFIVSGSMLAPVARSFTQQPALWRSVDGWAGYPATWRDLVRYIVKKKIQNVVFIAGDYHLSALACLRLRSGCETVDAYQIVASPFFAPLPFANAKADDYEWGAPLAGQPRNRVPFSTNNATIEVEPYLLSTSTSHFLRVDAHKDGSRWKIGLAVCDGNGVVVEPERDVKPPFAKGNDKIIRWSL